MLNKTGKLFLFLLFTILFFQSCIYDFYRKEFASDKKSNDTFFLLAALGLLPNPNQKLFQFIPGYSRNLSDLQFADASFLENSNKPKIVFIHGWNPAERDSDPITGDSKKIINIKNTFLNGIIHYQENRSAVLTDFDLYLYTYRTSNSILVNGRQFHQTLRSEFSDSDRVYIVAHSMGGLVTRVSLLPEVGNLPFVKTVVTLASPQFGSPFATPTFLGNNGFINEVGSYLVDTQGGKELGHTNNGNNQISLSNAENTILDGINQKFTLNAIFISIAGELLQSCTGYETFYYKTGCDLLVNQGFAVNDGIVPLNSAILGGGTRKNITVSNYDHSMMAFQTTNVDDTKSQTLFDLVITEIRNF
ncbi:hypothetical protein P3G55_09375 [Leptospira sp. 96542]|nr:hypothetical protein [Leptospira sp. 96542]